MIRALLVSFFATVSCGQVVLCEPGWVPAQTQTQYCPPGGNCYPPSGGVWIQPPRIDIVPAQRPQQVRPQQLPQYQPRPPAAQQPQSIPEGGVPVVPDRQQPVTLSPVDSPSGSDDCCCDCEEKWAAYESQMLKLHDRLAKAEAALANAERSVKLQTEAHANLLAVVNNLSNSGLEGPQGPRGPPGPQGPPGPPGEPATQEPSGEPPAAEPEYFYDIRPRS